MAEAESGSTASLADLNCSVCLDPFKDPRVLPCCHTFCRGCLDRILQENPHTKELSCPKCKSKHEISENGAGGFLTDYTVIDSLQTVDKDDKKKDPCCEQCDGGDVAVSYCYDCPSYLCGFCAQAHERIKLYRIHNVVSIETLSSSDVPASRLPSQMFCVVHPNEVLKVFCKTCSHLACCFCIVDTHNGHALAPIDSEIRRETESKVKELMLEAEVKLITIEEGLEYVKAVEEEVSKRPEELNQQINAKFDSLVASLESHRKELLEKVDTKHQEDCKVLWAQKESLETTVLGLKSALSFAKQSFFCSNDAHWLSLCSQILVRLNCLKDVELDRASTETVLNTLLEFEGRKITSGQLKSAGELDIVKRNDHWTTSHFKILKLEPPNPQLGEPVKAELKLRSTERPSLYFREYKMKVVHGKVEKDIPKPAVVTRNISNRSWEVSFVPVVSGKHKIQIYHATSWSQSGSCKEITVTGVPQMESVVECGPDWAHGSNRQNDTAIVSKYNESTQLLGVVWESDRDQTRKNYSWDRDGLYRLQLRL